MDNSNLLVEKDPEVRPPSKGAGTRSASVILGFALLCLSFTLNAMDRQVFYPLLPEIRKEFGFSLEQAGFLATGFTLGLAGAGFLAGFVVDRHSRKIVVILSILVYSLGTLAIPLASGLADMTIYRVVSGIGEGVQATALFAIAGSLFPRRRAFASGFIGVAFGAGVFIGPLIGVPFAMQFQTWRAPFFLFAALGVAMVVLIALLVPRLNAGGQDGAGAPTVEPESVEHVPSNPYNRNAILFGLTALVAGLVFYGFMGLYPTFLREELGFDTSQATIAIAMAGLGAMLAVLAGWLGDVMSQKWLLMGAFVLVALVGWLMYGVVTAPLGQYCLAFLMGALASGTLFTNIATAMQRSVRPANIGRGQGLFMLMYYVAAAFSGLLFASLVSSAGWSTAALWQLCILPLLAAAVLFFVNGRTMIGAGRLKESVASVTDIER